MDEPKLRNVLSELGIIPLNTTSSGWILCSCPFAALGFHANNSDRNPSFFAHINHKKPSGFNCYG